MYFASTCVCRASKRGNDTVAIIFYYVFEPHQTTAFVVVFVFVFVFLLLVYLYLYLFFVFASDNSVAIIFLLCIRVTSDQLPLSPLNNPFYILIRIPKGGDSDLRMLIGLLACLIFVTGTTGGACVNKFCLV